MYSGTELIYLAFSVQRQVSPRGDIPSTSSSCWSEHFCGRSTTDTYLYRWSPAARPGQAFDGMLGAVVRIAPPQDCGARFFVDSSKRIEGGLGEMVVRCHHHHQSPATEVHNFAFSLAAVSAGSSLLCGVFEVNSEPHTGARPSARLCVGLTIPGI
jgi:hypothetical protein